MASKLVVFDWNGTLLADTAACMEADNHVLEHFGGRPVDLKTYRETIIIPSIAFYAAHGCRREDMEAGVEEWARVFHTQYEARAARCRTRGGARKLLFWLGRHGVDCVILSNHTVSGIDRQVKRLGLTGCFREVIANPDPTASNRERNKREKLEAFLVRNHYEAGGVAIVGDSPEEVEIARGLGLISVAVAGGYYSARRLLESRSDYLASGLTAIGPVLEKRWGIPWEG